MSLIAERDNGDELDEIAKYILQHNPKLESIRHVRVDTISGKNNFEDERIVKNDISL
jgi:hypothetical protein